MIQYIEIEPALVRQPRVEPHSLGVKVTIMERLRYKEF